MTIALPAVTTPAPDAPAPARSPPRRALGRKLALALIGLVGFVLIVNGAVNLWLNYREARATAVRLQQEKAQAAAERIGLFVAEIESQIGWTTRAEWSFVALDQRRYDFIRLLRQAPAITELMQVDNAGKEQLRLSRLEPDVVASGADLSADPRFAEAAAKKIWFSPITFRHGSEPYMTIAMAQASKKPGVTIAEVNLKLIWDAVSAIHVGETGNAYIVDGKGKLVAHPDISLVLRETDLSALPQVASALGSPGAPPRLETDTASAPEGGTVLTAHAPIPRLGWTVFVQQPLREALAPLYASLIQSAVLLGLGLLLASLLGLTLARRITAPIRLLQAGAAQLGAGNLSQRLSVRTGDEIETLADQFNLMAGQVQESHETLEGKVAARTQELGEALAQQTATADVLKVISRSAFDLKAVLNTLIETGSKLCDAPRGVVWLRQGERFHLAASVGYSQEWIDQALALAIAPDPRADTTAGIVTFTGEMVHVEDFAADPRFNHNDAYKVGGYRSALMLPLIRDGKVEGTIGFTRATPGLFTPRQIELVQIFADQAVIAIQNVRLFEDVKARTRDLAEALEYQTATSEVLSVISRSPSEVQPVLDAIVATAARLCEADMAQIERPRDTNTWYATATFGHTREYSEFLEQVPFVPGHGSLTGRIIQDHKSTQIPDVLGDPGYELLEAQKRGGYRTLLGVPLLRQGTLIGVILLSRKAVRPFDGKHIDLVETFADQAVIAIENARLFDEVNARTKELSRSVSELKALGEVGAAVTSTLDLQKVQATIVTRAVELSGADAGAIFRYRKSDRTFRLAEAAGLDADHEAALRALTVFEMESAMGEATLSMQVAQVADIEKRPSYPIRDASLAAGFHAALILPLVVPGRTLGALVLQKRTVGEFPDNVVSLMQTFASQSVLAIQNARLFREIAEKSEQLELASQHKSQFLANMSHELRTPLNAILGYAELLVDGIYGELADKPRGVLERVQQNGKHLLGLINDVLDLSKIEAGQLTLAHEDYALPALIDTVVSATASLAQTKGLKLLTSVAPDLPHGHGDARRLTQVLLNLVGNALKFTDVGEVRIDAASADGRFRIAVTDTGPGIAEEDQKRVFEEFKQVDNSSTRNKGGSGLGLAISIRIVEMHGGSISVRSTLGAGSTFTIDLPVRAEPEAAA